MIPDSKGTSPVVWPLAGQFVKEKNSVPTHANIILFCNFFLFLLVVFLSSPPLSLFVFFFSFSLWPDVSYKVRLLGVWWTYFFFER